jgi:hypothetical protein
MSTKKYARGLGDDAQSTSPRCFRRSRAHLLVPVAGRPDFRRSRFEPLARCEMASGKPLILLRPREPESTTGGVSGR